MPPGSELPEDLVSLGRIVAPHGIKGEVKVHLETDFPERLVRGRAVIVSGYVRRILSSRVMGREAVLSLQGIDSRDAAEALRGRLIAVELASLPPLPEDTYYFHQIIGLRVEDEDGAELGSVRDIIATGANDVYVVDTPAGELMLPAIEQVVQAVDLPNGRLIVRLMPGLEPTSKPEPKTKPPRRGGPPAASPDTELGP